MTCTKRIYNCRIVVIHVLLWAFSPHKHKQNKQTKMCEYNNYNNNNNNNNHNNHNNHNNQQHHQQQQTTTTTTTTQPTTTINNNNQQQQQQPTIVQYCSVLLRVVHVLLQCSTLHVHSLTHSPIIHTTCSTEHAVDTYLLHSLHYVVLHVVLQQQYLPYYMYYSTTSSTYALFQNYFRIVSQYYCGTTLMIL